MAMEIHSVLEAYRFIKNKIRHPSLDERFNYNYSSDYMVFPLWGECLEGMEKAGVRYPSKTENKIYVMLTPELSKRISVDYKGFGTRVLAKGMTMTEEGVIQKPRLILGHLGLKKNIAKIDQEDKNIIIFVNDDSGAIFADRLLKSSLKKN